MGLALGEYKKVFQLMAYRPLNSKKSAVDSGLLFLETLLTKTG